MKKVTEYKHLCVNIRCMLNQFRRKSMAGLIVDKGRGGCPMKKYEIISMTISKKVIRCCLCVTKMNVQISTTSVVVVQDTIFVTTMMTVTKLPKKNMKRKEAYDVKRRNERTAYAKSGV